MRILKILFGWLVNLVTANKNEKNKVIHSVNGIADVVPTLSKNEVVLKRKGQKFEIFSLRKLTKEEINMIINGSPPEGLTVFVIQ